MFKHRLQQEYVMSHYFLFYGIILTNTIKVHNQNERMLVANNGSDESFLSIALFQPGWHKKIDRF